MTILARMKTSDRRFPSRLRDEGSIFHGLPRQIASGVLCQPGAKHESFVIISNHFRLKVSFFHGLTADGRGPERSFDSPTGNPLAVLVSQAVRTKFSRARLHRQHV